MTRTRPTASDVHQTFVAGDAAMVDDGGQVERRPPDAAVLSPAQQRALSRCAPLSTAEFKVVGRLVDRGNLPLRWILRRRQRPRPRPRPRPQS